MFSLMGNCVSWAKGKNERKDVTLLAVGLDNAGKTTTVQGVKGEVKKDVAPTIGFSSIDLRSGKYNVKIFDLGGGARIRGIWHNYMAECHGIIYVIDSSDVDRMEECRVTFDNLISDSRLRGKPVLILANKQDKPSAIDELDLCNRLNLDEVVNRNESYSKVVLCAALPTKPRARKKIKLDRGIKNGFVWLLDMIGQDFENLQERVTKDIEEQNEREAEENRQRIERVRRIREERENRENQENGEADLEERPRPEGVSHNELPNDSAPAQPQNSGLGAVLLDDDSDDDVITAPANHNQRPEHVTIPGTVESSTIYPQNAEESNEPQPEVIVEQNPRALSAASLRDLVRDTPTPTRADPDNTLESQDDAMIFTPTAKPMAVVETQDYEVENLESPEMGDRKKKKKKRKKRKNRIDPGSDENASEHSYQSGALPGLLTPLKNTPDLSSNGLGKSPPIRNAPNFDSDVEL